MEGIQSSATQLQTSISIESLKKAKDLQAANLGKLLDSAALDGGAPTLEQQPQISSGAKNLVTETTQRGGSLDLSA